MKGCFFHYCQAIWRKVQALGLATTYQSDPDLYRFVRRAAALPLAPVALVEDAWLHALADSPDTTKARLFADYVTETWIEGHFEQHMWNHFDTDGARTTNHLEGWHSKLNRIVKKSHPNLFEFILVIQVEQSVNEIKLLQIEGGAARPIKKRKYRRLEEKISDLKQKFSAGHTTMMRYLDSVSYLISI